MAPELQRPELAGSRCAVRPWRLSDARALRAACGDPEICRFTTVPHRFDIAGARAWIARQDAHARAGTAIVLAIVPRLEYNPVGMVGLFGLGSADSNARVGYWLITERRGQGLATCAARLLAEWAFAELKLTAIHIDHEPDNHASAHIADRLGAVITGVHSVELRGRKIELVRHTLSVDRRRLATPPDA